MVLGELLAVCVFTLLGMRTLSRHQGLTLRNLSLFLLGALLGAWISGGLYVHWFADADGHFDSPALMLGLPLCVVASGWLCGMGLVRAVIAWLAL